MLIGDMIKLNRTQIFADICVQNGISYTINLKKPDSNAILEISESNRKSVDGYHLILYEDLPNRMRLIGISFFTPSRQGADTGTQLTPGAWK